jgi:cytosine/adenosine deaminase-related metal-dependent hydrolase
MDKEKTYTGIGLIGDPPQPLPITLVVKEGIITHVEEESSAPRQWICPAFFNAHTHLGDTVAMDISGSGTLTELVTPPHGLKHQILAKTPPDTLIKGMRASISAMISSGTAGFADFREGGPAGVDHLRKASLNLPCRTVILGREGGEDEGDGAGISSARDIKDYAEIADRMKKKGKIVAFHAGERDNADIDAAIECEPSFLVHCTHAAPRQIRSLADAGIPVVVCPRSNFLLGVTTSASNPPLQAMIDEGVELYFGTDNAMFVNPDMMQELSFCHTVYGISPETLFSCSTRGFSPAGIYQEIKPGNPAKFFLLDVSKENLSYSHNPVASVIKRSPSRQICATIFYMK